MTYPTLSAPAAMYSETVVKVVVVFILDWLVVRAVIGCVWIDYATRAVASTE